MTVMTDDAFVRYVQAALRDRGHPITVDGIAGERTQSALLAALGPVAVAAKPPTAPANPSPLSAASEAKLQGVHADLVRVIRRAAEIGEVPFVVLEGLRSIERQRELVAKGASRTLNSRHLTGHAVDIAPLVKGTVSWAWPDFDRILPAVRQAARELGVAVVLGADWASFRDGPHVELDRKAYP